VKSIQHLAGERDGRMPRTTAEMCDNRVVHGDGRARQIELIF
jgi:hypothetical protein